jgi:hypothetical protein
LENKLLALSWQHSLRSFRCPDARLYKLLWNRARYLITDLKMDPNRYNEGNKTALYYVFTSFDVYWCALSPCFCNLQQTCVLCESCPLHEIDQDVYMYNIHEDEAFNLFEAHMQAVMQAAMH